MMRGLLLITVLLLNACAHQTDYRATGDLGVVIERASGSLQIINTSQHRSLSRVSGLGDLSHASVVYSRDERFAYVFGRDGGLTKVDLLEHRIAKRIIQGGNSIGGAISQDGTMVAVSNYEPGGVKIFSTDSLELIADIPAEYTPGQFSKTVGLVDAPGNRFVFSLYDGNEIWLVDMSVSSQPQIQKFKDIGKAPYDGLITPDGRFYIAGLFGEDGMAKLDLWHPERGAQRILNHYGKGTDKLPVYKMPHLEGWAISGEWAFFPAVGHHEALQMNLADWQLTRHIATHGQPVFVMSQPDHRRVWVNFAFPDNDTVQVIDTETARVIHQFKPGKGVLHMEFTPRGEQVWISVRDENRVEIYDTHTFEQIATLPAQAPSGIFFTNRAHKIGL
ncbi:MAG: protein nirF [Ketobacter sp.]|nr:MAG: protein nirF [Ketobacter sp.]